MYWPTYDSYYQYTPQKTAGAAGHTASIPYSIHYRPNPLTPYETGSYICICYTIRIPTIV